MEAWIRIPEQKSGVVVEGERLENKLITVSEWFSDSISHLQKAADVVAISAHIDRFDRRAADNSEVEEIAHGLYGELLELSADQAGHITVKLAFALRYSSSLSKRAPDPQHLRQSLRTIEPPSLYICRRSMFARWNGSEQYRIPLAQTIHDPTVGQVRSYYSCSRYPTDAEFYSEYSRTVWFERYTDDQFDGRVE